MERSVKKPVDKNPDVPTSVKTNPNKPDTYSNDDSWLQAEKIDLSFLLNLLDGVLEIPGRIVIMTSNFPEKLDHALIRPGRIDVIANFTKCRHETMIEMMEFFYDIILTDEEKEAIMRTNEYVISPAEMSKIMFENFGNHAGAIQKLGEIVVPSIQSIKKEDVPIEVETIDKAIFQPMVDEIEKKKQNLLYESSHERIIQMHLDAQSRSYANINSFTDKIDTVSDPNFVVKTPTFPDDNRIDRMNDRKQQLSEFATFTDGMNANWLTAVGNEDFIPPKSSTVVLPYESESQTNQFSSFE
jgi:hypothetical protein